MEQENRQSTLEGLEFMFWPKLVEATAEDDSEGIAEAKRNLFEVPEVVANRLVKIYSDPDKVEDAELRMAIGLAPELVDRTKNSDLVGPVVDSLWLLRRSQQSDEMKQLAVQSFEQCIEMAIKHGSQDSSVFVSRGKRLLEEQKFDLAIDDFTQAIKLDPTNERAFVGRAKASFHKEDYSTAVDDFTRAIEINPDRSETWFHRGCTLLQLDDSEKALADFDQSLKLDPTFSLALKLRSKIYQSQGENEKADADLKRAQELDGGSK